MATMRAPEEVFQSAQHGQPRTAEELTRKQRRAARAKRKRGGKKEKEGQVSVLGGTDSVNLFCSALCLEPEGVAGKKPQGSWRRRNSGVPWGAGHLLPLPCRVRGMAL